MEIACVVPPSAGPYRPRSHGSTGPALRADRPAGEACPPSSAACACLRGLGRCTDSPMTFPHPARWASAECLVQWFFHTRLAWPPGGAARIERALTTARPMISTPVIASAAGTPALMQDVEGPAVGDRAAEHRQRAQGEHRRIPAAGRWRPSPRPRWRCQSQYPTYPAVGPVKGQHYPGPGTPGRGWSPTPVRRHRLQTSHASPNAIGEDASDAPREPTQYRHGR